MPLKSKILNRTDTCIFYSFDSLYQYCSCFYLVPHQFVFVLYLVLVHNFFLVLVYVKKYLIFFVLVLNFIQDSNAAAHYFRNLLFGPPSDDYSHIRVWPRIQDTLDLITEDSTAKDLVHIRELLTEEVSRAIAAIHAATYILSDDLHI